jgi:hypothetical protein
LSKAGLKAVPLFLCLFWPARKTKKEKSPLASGGRRLGPERPAGGPKERRNLPQPFITATKYCALVAVKAVKDGRFLLFC